MYYIVPTYVKSTTVLFGHHCFHIWSTLKFQFDRSITNGNVGRTNGAAFYEVYEVCATGDLRLANGIEIISFFGF